MAGARGVRLEISYRDGRPYVGYVHLPRRRGEKYNGSRPVEPGLVLDYSKTGKLMGIEFLAPELLTAKILDGILEKEGFPALRSSICHELAQTKRRRRHGVGKRGRMISR